MPKLTWQAALKKAKVELELLTETGILLMVEKRISGGICHSIKEPSYIKYYDVNNLYGSAMSQQLPVNGFKWVEDRCEYDEGFIKSYTRKSKEWCFLEVDIQYPKNLDNVQIDLPFLPENINIHKA